MVAPTKPADEPSADSTSTTGGAATTPAPQRYSDLPTTIAGEPLLPRAPSSRTAVTHGLGIAVAGLGSLVGVRWGDFELGDLLGQGGMGAVYRGRQVSLDRAVAIKVLPPVLAERLEMRERFIREARAIAPVASPHVVQVIHAGSYEGWYFYVMELVDGPDLAHRLRAGGAEVAACRRRGVRPDRPGGARSGRRGALRHRPS